MVGKGLIRCLLVTAFLIAVMNVPNAHAQGRHRGTAGFGVGQGVAPVFVIGYEAVQRELALKPDQVDRVKELVAEVRGEWTQQIQAAGLDSSGSRQQNLSREDRQKWMAETQPKRALISKNVNDKFRTKLAEILDKTQQVRLHQIAIQAAGSQAFQDAQVAQDLGLTKVQQVQIVAVGKEYSEKIAQLRLQGGRRDTTERSANSNELRQEQLAKSTEILTKEQQEKFADMKGKAFDLAQMHQLGGRHSAKTKGVKST
jgi:hypothetical protein